jgi:DNA-binding NarL/FixJ family response regulator
MSQDSDAAKKITIAIVDDHHVLVETLKLVIQAEPDMQVVGEAGTCAGCLDLLREVCPSVLLLDVSLPDGDGLSMVPKINKLYPQTNVLVLTSFSDEATLMRAIDLGVSGFIGKNQHLTELTSAIRQAASGEIAIPASLLLGLLGRKPPSRSRSQNAQYVEPLTVRERQILNCLAQGNTGQEIAAKLNISQMTVRTHIRNLIAKLGVHSRLEAVTYALQWGLIEPPMGVG